MAQTLQFLFNLDVAMSNGFSQPMKACTSQMQKMGETAKKLQAQSKQIDSFRRMSETVKTSGTRLEYLRGCLASNGASLTRSRERTESLSQQYEQAKKRVADWSKTMPKGSMQLMFAKRRAAELKREFQESAKLTERLEREQSKLYKAVGTAEQKLAGETSQLESMKKALHESGVNTDKLTEQQEKLKEAAQRTAQAQAKIAEFREKFTWGNIKSDLIQSAGLVMAMRKPVQIDMEFEQAIANVRAVSNATEEEFTRLRTQALQLGSTTQFTATQAANAQEVLKRAGQSTPEVIMTMPSLLSMSSAEGMEIPQAADILVNTLQGLRLDAGYAPILSDLFAYTSANANTNISQLGEAMKEVASLSETVQIPAESMFALLGSMTSAVRGSQAGTALSSSLARMYAPTAEVQKAYREIGVAYKTKSGGIVRPEVLLQKIADKTQGLGTADQMRIYETIFGKNHLSAMSALMKNIKGGQYEKLYSGLVSKRDGASAKMTGLRNDTLKGDITSLGSAWEVLMIRIGHALDPINRIFVQGITQAVQWVNKLIDRLGVLPEIIAQGVYIAGGFFVFGKVAKYVSLIVQGFRAFLELRTATKLAETAGIASNMAGAAKGASLFGMSLNTALGYIGVIVTASILIYENWEKITQWAEKAGQAIANIDTSKIASAKAGTLSRSDPQYGISVMESTYAMPQISPHATGGIMTRPHIGLVAEAGPEAVIPLRDKARGIPLLIEAMNILMPRMSQTLMQNALTGYSMAGSNTVTRNAQTLTQNALTGYSMAGSNTVTRNAQTLTQNALTGYSMAGNNTVTRNAQTLTQNALTGYSMAGGNTVTRNAQTLTQNALTGYSMAEGDTVTRNTGMNAVIDALTENTASSTVARIVERLTNINTEKGSVYHAGVRSYSGTDNINRNIDTGNFHPTVNMTVNITGENTEMNIAERIKQAVLDALSEVSEYRERVAFA